MHGDIVAAAELGSPLSQALRWDGEAARGTKVLADAREVLERAPGPGLVAVLAAQSNQAYVADHATEALALADASITTAAHVGIAPHYRALQVRAALSAPSDIGQAEVDLLADREGAIQAGDLSAAAYSWIILAWLQRRDVSYAAAIETHEQAIAFLRERGLPTEQAYRGRLQLLYAAGRWDDALAEVASLRPSYAARGDEQGLWACDQIEGWILLARGEQAPMLGGILARAAALGRDPADTAALAAEAAMASGDVAGALSILGQAIETGFLSGIDFPAEFVRACVRAEAPALARRALEKGVKPGDLMAASATLARAMLSEAAGCVERALGEYDAAATALQRHADVAEHAYALMGLGSCLLELGDTSAGVARLLEARDSWARLRATPRITEIDALLSSGRSP